MTQTEANLAAIGEAASATGADADLSAIATYLRTRRPG
jgi:hypothetical protein